MKIYLGTLGTNICLISDKAENSSILINGISGSGKTTRMLQIELQSVADKNTVIVIDTAHSHTDSEIKKLTGCKCISKINRISALLDGLNLPFLTQFPQERNYPEPDFLHIASITSALSKPLKLGAAQTAILRESIIFATKRLEDYSSDMEAIVAGLTRFGDKGSAVYNRLWQILNCNAFNPNSTKSITSGKINTIDLNGYDIDIQKVLAEIILASFFRLIRCGQFPEISAYHIFLDECQRFSYDANGSICQLLREGRKFNIHLVLATQTFSTFSKDALAVLNQAATRLYFRPSQTDIHKIAKALSPEEWKSWKTRLANLKVGECIASGIFDVNGQEINRPLLLH